MELDVVRRRPPRNVAIAPAKAFAAAASRSFCPPWNLPSTPTTATTTQSQLQPSQHLDAYTTPAHILQPCLAAAALRSTSPASATEHALATSPTSSNGMSSPQLDRPRIHLPHHNTRFCICFHVHIWYRLRPLSCATPLSLWLRLRVSSA